MKDDKMLDKNTIELSASKVLGVPVTMPFLAGREVTHVEESMRGGKAFEEGRVFDCVRCGAHVESPAGMWIFYDLCDPCFVAFDGQKMRGRFSGFDGGERIPHYESATEWAAANPVGVDVRKE